jgi:hypothetical protein
MALAILSINDVQFLSAVRTDLESTLWRYGFALSPEEMDEARQYLTDGATLSDEAIIQGLREQIESPEDARARWFRP